MTTGSERDSLRVVGDEFKKARTALDQAREALHPRMVKALKSGMPQKDVADLSGYTRESVRTLARANGIEAR